MIEYSDLVRIARVERMDLPRVRRTLEGERCRGIEEAKAARICSLAQELQARAPAVGRIRVLGAEEAAR